MGTQWGPSPPQHASPLHFRPMPIVAKRSPISATAELLLHRSRQSVVGHIGATWRIRLNLCFFRPTRSHNPNGKSIGSAILHSSLSQNCPFPWGNWTPSNTWFPGPTRVLNPNHISIGAAVFAELTSVTDRQIDRTQLARQQ